MASFSHAAPSFNRAAGESHGSFASFGHGAEVHRNTATIHSFDRARGLEAPRGSTAATYTHAHGAYGGMEHAGAAATGGGPQHYAHDPRGFALDRDDFRAGAPRKPRRVCFDVVDEREHLGRRVANQRMAADLNHELAGIPIATMTTEL